MNFLASIYNHRNICDFSSFSLFVLTEPMIDAEPSDAEVIYGDDVTLTCTVFSDEIPGIIWKHIQTSQLTRIKPTVTSNSLKYDCSLMISNVDLMDSGDYFFVVSNTNGSKMSETASLLVIGWLILS